ncbi:S41 family peptidase [Cohnella pontilimi]|uniref:S41 family peptidase n=1 Tax=Cohnella pontilimi TaxID=2564100 RepID=A0A4U0FH11_9BACL|nr:S41 family peptidase [Cohnella pontilimi]TJY44245.1 S41 family peptidase [Cohnella pontilimi]
MKMKKRPGIRYVLALLLSVALSGIFTISNAGAATTEQVNEVRNLLEQYHLNKPDNSNLNDAVIDAMVESLHDPYTEYFNEEEWKRFSDSLEQTFVGIGIVMAEEAGGIYIEDVILGSPAEKAGLLPGDQIVSAEGKSVKGLALPEVQQKLRGEEGTLLKIGISRNGKTLTFTITRKSIQLPVATGQMMGDGIGYLSLSGFTSDAGELFRNQLVRLEQAGMKSLIIDLRNNGGGYVNAAQQIAALFLKDGVLAHMKDRDGKDIPLPVQGEGRKYPVTILVNGGTASASELLAGALQDYGVAKLTGTQTFGKGVVQSIIPLESGGVLKVTVQEYFTPKGRTVNKKGLTPNHVVEGSGEQLIRGFRDAGGRALTLKAGKGSVVVNGIRAAEREPAIQQGKVWYVNLRLAAAMAGAELTYDLKNRKITVKSKTKSYTLNINDKRLLIRNGWSLIDTRALNSLFANVTAQTTGGQLQLTSR